jgi:hypothetical protein
MKVKAHFVRSFEMGQWVYGVWHIGTGLSTYQLIAVIGKPSRV